MLDRETGEFLRGAPFVKVTWAKGLDDSGRPILTPGAAPTVQGAIAYPGVQGGTNWYSPSYSPLTGLFYVTSWDDYYSVYFKWEQEYVPGAGFTGGSTRGPISPTRRRRFNNWPRDAGYGAIRALEPATGKKVWEFRMADVSDSGLLTTASNILVSGNREGHFLVLDARTGKLLTRRYLGGQVASSAVTYMVDGKQYISLASGSALFTFALRD
jgi:alcohol dehydrogenase (cytochrome c)